MTDTGYVLLIRPVEIVKKIHDDYQSDKTQEVSQEKNTDNKTPSKANKK